jgi:hypothetical protein
MTSLPANPIPPVANRALDPVTTSSAASRNPTMPDLPSRDWPFSRPPAQRLSNAEYDQLVASAPDRAVPKSDGAYFDTPKKALTWASGGIDQVATLGDIMVNGITGNEQDFTFTSAGVPRYAELITRDLNSWARTSYAKSNTVSQLQDSAAAIAVNGAKLASSQDARTPDNLRNFGMQLQDFDNAAHEAINLFTSDKQMRVTPEP